MLIAVWIFIFGLIVGSFLNVVVLRLHAKKSFIGGRSSCPHCKHTLSAWELIPVLSWVILGGRCRSCRQPISAQYPLVELTTGLAFLVTYLTHPPAGWLDVAVLVLWLYVIASLIVLAVYDLKWYILPDKVLLPLIAPAVVIAVIQAFQAGSYQVFLGPLYAGLLFGGGFYALAAVSKGKWMGGGDVKLAFVMGLLLGLKKTFLAMLIAFNSAAIVGLVLIAMKRKKRADRIPFGPFLIAGTIIAYLWGGAIINWYTQITGLYLLDI